MELTLLEGVAVRVSILTLLALLFNEVAVAVEELLQEEGQLARAAQEAVVPQERQAAGQALPAMR
jgi:hypothetical protein